MIRAAITSFTASARTAQRSPSSSCREPSFRTRPARSRCIDRRRNQLFIGRQQPHRWARVLTRRRLALSHTEEYASRPGHAQLARVPVGGGSIERLLESDTVDWFPHLSPDGKMATTSASRWVRSATQQTWRLKSAWFAPRTGAT